MQITTQTILVTKNTVLLLLQRQITLFSCTIYTTLKNGIMCIVMPHGVLFRGGSEKDIRTQLVENNNIETIIGLPSNCFYGTGISTIIMVLKKHREQM